MNPGERPRTTPTTPPPQLESVLGGQSVMGSDLVSYTNREGWTTKMVQPSEHDDSRRSRDQWLAALASRRRRRTAAA